jgi:hypothetical protein
LLLALLDRVSPENSHLANSQVKSIQRIDVKIPGLLYHANQVHTLLTRSFPVWLQEFHPGLAQNFGVVVVVVVKNLSARWNVADGDEVEALQLFVQNRADVGIF